MMFRKLRFVRASVASVAMAERRRGNYSARVRRNNNDEYTQLKDKMNVLQNAATEGRR